MGDDLGDEWWSKGENVDHSDVEEESQDIQEAADEPTEQNVKIRKFKSQKPDKAKKIKTVQKECFIAKKKTVEEEGKKPKKRRKKKTIMGVLASSKPLPGTTSDLKSLLQSHYGATRSVIEQEELSLPESSFLMSNDLTHSLSSYLKEVCPKWAKVQKQHKKISSVILLILCSSALRTIELIKQLTTFKGEAKVVKLFAKHIKIEDQIKLLKKGAIHIGVGTPGRVAALIDKEGMNLQALQYLVLDWNYRDQKHRRMVDILEVKRDFLKLLESEIIKKCQGGSVKIGLF
ncbi:protein CMSS1 [Hoplias malabaricus]|uniref:protein CMSS1 n=1 Tax=Hoplias malabaricus TaxID=27720 RepID=UPI003461B328